MAKWNYRGKRRLGAQPQLAPDAFEYDDRRLTLDLNLDVEIKKWLQFYVAAQNVFNARAITMRYGSVTPAYAKYYLTGANGVGITMGIKGTF